MSPALFFRKHSQEKPIFSFSSKPVPQQSPQPHELTSGLLYLDPEPEVYTTLQARRKAEHPLSHYPQQLLNPESDPWPDFPSLRHSPPLQRGRRYQSLSLPSPSSPKKPLSPFPEQSSQSITQQLPKSDPMSDFQPFSHPPPWQKGRRHHPRAFRIESVPNFPSQNRPLSTLSQESSHTHPPPLSRPDYEESVEYTGSSFTYDSPNGISLHFPTVAECEAAIKISIKVVNDDYILPEGYEDMDLVSSMFKLTASADLPAPVTVRMEHCAVVEEDDSLVHMIAHGPPPYSFKLLEGGEFPIGEYYGEFHTKAFSIFTTLARKLGLRLSLSVQVFYHSRNRAVVVVTKNLQSQISTVERKYATATKALELTMSCSYSTNAIILTMPQPKKPGGWLVESDFEPAQIETRDIIEYAAGMTPPSIHLRMKWEGEGNPVEDSVRIGITGASLTSFLLDCKPPILTPPMPSPHHSQSWLSALEQRAPLVPQPSLTPLESQHSTPHSTSSLQLHTMLVEPITLQIIRTGQLSIS